MKKIFVLLAILASFSFAATDYRNSFFFDASATVSYLSYYYDNDSGFLSPRGEHKEFDGTGAAVNIKIGESLKQAFAVHGTMELGYFNGDFFYNKSKGYLHSEHDEGDDNVFKVFLGGGVLFTPFRNPELLMHNFFANVDLGVTQYVDSRSDSENDHGISYTSFGVHSEVGRLWNITEHWNIGLQATFAVDIPFEEDSGTFLNVGAGIKFLRK